MSDIENAPQSGYPPSTWLVRGDKLGDNAQIDLVAAKLGWRCHNKDLVFLPRFRAGKPRFRPTLSHLDLAQSAPLAAPWPELIITVGRRPSMAALAIRRLSGNRTRVVMIGRPRRLRDLALGVATPQYAVPPAGNIMHLHFPLMNPDQDALEAARREFADRLEPLPRPLTAILIGGSTSPYVLDTTAAARLQAGARAACPEGTLFYSTSRRTSPEVAEFLRASMEPNEHLYAWQPRDPANPYFGLLAHADRAIVTCDSVSMMIEVARQGKPLAVFDVPIHYSPAQKVRRLAARALNPTRGGIRALKQWIYAAGIMSYPRDLGRIQRILEAQGKAVPLGREFPCPHDGIPDESGTVADRIRAIFASA